MSLDRTKVLETAQKYLAKSQYDKAIAEYRKLVQDDPKDVRTWLKIGDLFTRKGARQEACDTYNRVAKQYADQGFFLKAVAVYKQILKLDPNRLDVSESLGEMYEQLQLVSDALATYEHVAGAYSREGNVDKALGTLDKMATLDPENVPIRIKYAEALSRANRTEAAAQAFEEGAELLKEQGRIDDYMKVAERLLFHRPNDVKCARELAELYLERNDAKRALGKLQVCFKADPRNIDTLELLARAFKLLGQIPKTVSVYREVAKLHQEANRPEERARALKTILELDPADAEARAALAAFAPNRRDGSVARREAAVGRKEGSGARKAPEAPAPAPAPAPAAAAPPPAAPKAAPPPPPARAMPPVPPPSGQGAAPGRPPPPPVPPKMPLPKPAAAAPPEQPRERRSTGEAPKGERDRRATGEAQRREMGGRESSPLELEDDVPQSTSSVVSMPEPRNRPDSGAVRVPEAPRSTTQRTSDPDLDDLDDLAPPPAPGAAAAAPIPAATKRDDVVHIVDDDDDDLGEATVQGNVDLDARGVAVIDDDDDDVVIVDDRDDGLGQPPRPKQEDRTGEVHSIPPDVAREAQIARLLTECDVFMRYGLKAKVLDQLRHVLEIDPDHVEARERLRDVLLEVGRRDEAVTELVALARILRDRLPSIALAHLTRAIELDPAHEEARHELEMLAALGLSGAARLTEATVPETTPPSALSSAPSSPPSSMVPRDMPTERPPPPTDKEPTSRAAIPPPQASVEAQLEAEMSPEEFDAVPVRHSDPGEQRAIGAPGEVEEILEEAEFFVAQGLFEEARATLGDALRAHPNNILIHEMLNEIEHGAVVASQSTSFIPSAGPDQSFQLAEKLAEELEVAAPDNGLAGADVLDVESVFAQFKKGVQEQVGLEDSDTHFDLGIAYKEMGLIDDAIQEFNLSMSNPHRECIAHTMIGLCFIEKGEVADAISHFKKGLYADTKTDREEVGLYFELGAAYELLHDPKEALYYFQKVQKRDPTFRHVGDRIANLTTPRTPAANPGPPAIAKDDVDKAFDELLGDD